MTAHELSDATTAHELTVVAVLALVALEPEEPEFSLTGVEPFEFEIASVVLGPVEPVAVAVLGVAVSDLGPADFEFDEPDLTFTGVGLRARIGDVRSGRGWARRTRTRGARIDFL